MAFIKKLTYPQNLILLIAFSTVLKLFLINATELGSDEAYYWSYALKLQLNYFDHPPMVAYLIRLTTLNLLFHNEFAVRLGAVISSGICTWLIFRLGTLVKNEQTGWFAALLYTASVYCSINAGAVIVPDSPQMIFWLSGVLIFIKISRVPTGIQKADLLWCLFGVASGLCIMCKVHGVFLWIGVLLYTLITNRSWLKHRGIYLSVTITLIIISPIIIWNIQNDFIAYKFHSSRVDIVQEGINLTRFIKAIFQEITINNPISFFLICVSLILAFKGKIQAAKKEINILLLFNLPLIAVILIISLFRVTLPHWSAPAYTCLLILPAIVLESAAKSKVRLIPNVVKWALAYVVFAALLRTFTLNYFPGTLSLQKDRLKKGADDLTLDSYGWANAGEKFDSLYRSDGAKKIMPSDPPIVITNWDSGAHIEFYFAKKNRQEVLGIGDILDLHEYYWTNKYKKQLKKGDDAYYIVPSDGFYYRTSNKIISHFSSYDAPIVLSQYRSGVLCRYVSIYRMRGYK